MKTPRVANILRAISHKREAVFRKETNYLRLRFIITRLEASYHNRLWISDATNWLTRSGICRVD